MKHDVSFTASVKNGNLRAADAGFARRAVASFEGEQVEVIVRKWKAKRSNKQNAWEWAVAIPLIAEHCGYDAHEHEALHYELSKIYFGKRVNDVTGFETPVGRTSRLDTKDYCDWMEWLCRWAAKELGVVIPLPSERFSDPK
jgi:hypothetical protein